MKSMPTFIVHVLTSSHAPASVELVSRQKPSPDEQQLLPTPHDEQVVPSHPPPEAVYTCARQTTDGAAGGSGGGAGGKGGAGGAGGGGGAEGAPQTYPRLALQFRSFQLPAEVIAAQSSLPPELLGSVPPQFVKLGAEPSASTHVPSARASVRPIHA
jgi:hypothetical protein